MARGRMDTYLLPAGLLGGQVTFVYDGTPMRMAHRAHLGLPCLALAASSCMSSGPTTLVVASTGFTQLEGATVKLSLLDVASNKIEQLAPAATVSGGKFSFSLDIHPGTQYRVDLYADVDGDGHCQVGVDKVYAVDVMDVTEGDTMTANIDFNSQDSRGCLSFGASSIHVTATSFSA